MGIVEIKGNKYSIKHNSKFTILRTIIINLNIMVIYVMKIYNILIPLNLNNTN